MDDWAKEFEEKTGGRYTVEVVHGGALAAIPEAYDVVLGGIADISNIVTQDVEKPFPMAEVTALPWRYSPMDVATEAMFFNVYKEGYLDKDYADVKILYTHVSPQDDFITINPVYNVADAKGIKMVAGGGPGKPKVMQRLGGVPVFGVPPEAYTMVQKGITDGMYISGMGLKEFHWYELVNYIIEPLRLGHVVFIVAMNMDTFNKMPDDVKAIIDEMNAEGQYNMKVAVPFQGAYEGAIEFFLAEGGTEGQGGQIIEWSPEAMAELEELIAPIWEEWIAEKEAMGLPAREAVDTYYNGLKERGIEKPALGYTPGG